MSNLSYIDTKKSIELGRLIVNKSTLDKVEDITDIIVWSTLCIVLISFPTFAYFQVTIQNSNDIFIAFIFFPLMISFGLFSLYRKLIEKRLIKIDTSLSRHKNRQYLLDFFNSKGYEVITKNNDAIIVNIEESLSFNNIWTKEISFLIDDNSIYFTMTKNYPRLNPPVFFSHRYLKADLKKYFKDK